MSIKTSAKSIRTSNKTISKSFIRKLTHSIRLLPDFLIIGAQKSGTTTLFNYLEDHPNIGVPTAKELHFFDRTDRFNQGLSWYRSQFPTQIQASFSRYLSHQKFITGEATPSYFFHPNVPQRIANVLPNIKLIVLLRNPIDRAYSHYQMSVRNGKEHLSFEAAISQESTRVNPIIERMRQDKNYFDSAYARYSYLSRSIYIDQIEHWYKFFRPEQLLIIKSEDFFENPIAVLEQVFSFLDIPQYRPLSLKASYVGNYQNIIDPSLRNHLKHYFEPYNQKLYKLIGINYAWEN